MKLTKDNTTVIQRLSITAGGIIAVCACVSLVIAAFEFAPKVALGLFFGAIIFTLVHSWIWDEKSDDEDTGYY